ncbi:DUF4291 domain-containing protein [Capnocytophaga stomatis]|uniref:DUF4291 domain-containing protein n=1 Tax=Capnocytophaga stomatis TaxID=1848904 RepID=A0ABW8Q9N7_9FLAO|nr:DUF4291 domain-containing protein [Capnocytophaga stomatis]GIJ94542.1 hypothetical protein CAPN002_17600 [Capnocytophaga stomatis]
MQHREQYIQEIRQIISEQDKRKLENVFYKIIAQYSRDEEVLLLLCQIFESDWHTFHEDMALGFQSIRNPITAQSLFNIAFSNFEYLKEDENYPLQRKCTWALADIGTDEAKKFLEEIRLKALPAIAQFADKRLRNWEEELRRKGQKLRSERNYHLAISLEKYTDSLKNLPNEGQNIVGNVLEIKDAEYNSFLRKVEYITTEYIVVYQAYNPKIAKYAVENQTLGGEEFSYSRMSWIKTNFLWMMFRSGWAEKQNQEKILAIWIEKKDFQSILQDAVFSSYQPHLYESEDAWRKELEQKEVRLQWDPDRNYLGEKLKRRAIQLGLKGKSLEKFGTEQIVGIMDITDFVKEQKSLIDSNQVDKLLIPKERIIYFDDGKNNKRIDLGQRNNHNLDTENVGWFSKIIRKFF